MRKSLLVLALLTGLCFGITMLRADDTPPRVWVVDETGYDCPEADFQDIQPAVDAASPGDTIVVCPGLYSPVKVDKDDLTIVSLEDPQRRGMHTIVRAPNEASNVFTITSDRVTVKGLWITGAARGDEGTGHGFFITGTSVSISWCTSTLNDRFGVALEGGKAHEVERCTIVQNGDGIHVGESVVRARIHNNRMLERYSPEPIEDDMEEVVELPSDSGD